MGNELHYYEDKEGNDQDNSVDSEWNEIVILNEAQEEFDRRQSNDERRDETQGQQVKLAAGELLERH